MMKIMRLLFLTCLLAGVVSAQQESSATLPEAPDVTVIQNKWRREVRHPALDEDPFMAGRAATDIEQDKKDILKANVTKKQMGRDTVPLAATRHPTLVSSIGPVPTYVYEAKIMNTGTKTIRAVVWEYVFFDSDTQVDVGRHQYKNEVNLRPGKNKTLGGSSQSPQTSIINVTKADKGLQHQYSERVIINRIEYADGSFWQRASN